MYVHCGCRSANQSFIQLSLLAGILKSRACINCSQICMDDQPVQLTKPCSKVCPALAVLASFPGLSGSSFWLLAVCKKLKTGKAWEWGYAVWQARERLVTWTRLQLLPLTIRSINDLALYIISWQFWLLPGLHWPAGYCLAHHPNVQGGSNQLAIGLHTERERERAKDSVITQLKSIFCWE